MNNKKAVIIVPIVSTLYEIVSLLFGMTRFYTGHKTTI